MVVIDGSYGSGGGQMLRTAVGLAARTGTPMRMVNIRAGRKQPGMREQHLQAVRAVNDFCGGSLEGASQGSSELTFEPGTDFRGNLTIHIRTAGSVGLVLQALSVAAFGRKLSVRIEGGATFGLWAPPVYYLRYVLAPFLAMMNCHMSIDVKREGFYPKGGALTEVSFSGPGDGSLVLPARGAVKRIRGLSVASLSLKKRKVAERQAASAERFLSKEYDDIEIDEHYSQSVCPGSGVALRAETEHAILGGSAIGELRKRAEDVGKEAALDLHRNLAGGSVDRYAADQLLPFLALNGGRISTSEITEHARTNAYVIGKFPTAAIAIRDNVIAASE
jgi:RNA 3'-terminal phosphate cyclase (ATP)/RNA 3'-terminal phosphate cyclase (GTP)